MKMFYSKIKTHDIKALSCALAEEKSIEKELENKGLTQSKIKHFKENFGFSSHFVASKDVYASDLASKALKVFFDEKCLAKEELDKLIVVSQTPDYFAPSLSQLIHKNLNLSSKTLCVDLCFFCIGFLQGLYEAFLSFNDESINQVVLICVSVKSKKIDPKDLITSSSISDSASATLIKRNCAPNFGAFAYKIMSEFSCLETKTCSAYKQGFSEFICMDQQLFFQLVCEHFPEFMKKFLEQNQEASTIFLQSANAFFYKKLLTLITQDDKHIFFNQSNANFANTDSNHLALNLCLHQQALAGGGG